MNVKCGTLAKKSLNVSWSKPTNPNGVIRRYKVSWQKIKNKNAKENEPGDERDVKTVDKRLTNIGDGKLGKLSFIDEVKYNNTQHNATIELNQTYVKCSRLLCYSTITTGLWAKLLMIKK